MGALHILLYLIYCFFGNVMVGSSPRSVFCPVVFSLVVHFHLYIISYF